MSTSAPTNPHFGSTLYFCTRSLSLETKQAIQVLLNLAHTLYDIAERYQEPDVARIKLLWWKEELNLLFEKKPRHPLTQQLLPFCTAFGLASSQFDALIQGVLNSLEVQSYETQTDLEQHFSHTGGVMILMMGKICQFPKPLTNAEENMLIRTGVSIEIIRHMVNFPFLVQRGHLPLPLKELDKLKLEPSALIQKNHHAELKILLLQQAERARTLASEILSSTTPSLRPLRQYTALQLALLHQIAQDDFQVLSHQWSLGAFKKWWLSWRTP